MSNQLNLDEKFFSILHEWTELSGQCAESAVLMILNNSGEYLTDEQQKAVTNFHDLYFSDGDVASSKESMNREVDDLIDAIRTEMDTGKKSNYEFRVNEDDDAKKTRLSLSGVQKSLETIIQLESGLKDKLVPVLTSMQFEDTIKQRLRRLVMAWEMSFKGPINSQDEIVAVAEAIGLRLGSQVERDAFYPNVLKREPPRDAVEEITFLDSLT